jgi:hypothetical protein
VSDSLRYDRQLLLLGPKRNSVLELWEIHRYGVDSYGDSDYVSIYGLRPDDWYARGIRLLGRTAVECTRDDLAREIGEDIAAIARKVSGPEPLVIDPFAGSGNTLYWILHHLPGVRGLGFELDTAVFDLTSRNLASLQLSVDVLNTDYLSGLGDIAAAPAQPVITFIAPPWGDALSRTSGLDVRRTTPPITDIVDVLIRKFSENPLLCAIQVYEAVDPASLVELTARFDWSAMRIYHLNEPGQNHGILLGTKGWMPSNPRVENDAVAHFTQPR